MSGWLTYMADFDSECNIISRISISEKENYMISEGFDEREGLIWYNGAMIDWRQANLHVLSHALHYASCVFEGERVYGGSIFKLREHTERLLNSAEILGFNIRFGLNEIDQACTQVCEANDIIDGYVRPVAWRGSEMMGVSAQNTKIHLAIAAWPWPSYFPQKQD